MPYDTVSGGEYYDAGRVDRLTGPWNMLYFWFDGGYPKDVDASDADAPDLFSEDHDYKCYTDLEDSGGTDISRCWGEPLGTVTSEFLMDQDTGEIY